MSQLLFPYPIIKNKIMGDTKEQQFKSFTPKQARQMPSRLDGFSGERNLTRVVDVMSDRLDITPLKLRKPGQLGKVCCGYDAKILTWIKCKHMSGRRDEAQGLNDATQYWKLTGK